eukprot:scaffold404923_cov39-Prasinocladus_malaysianus.AAC.1
MGWSKSSSPFDVQRHHERRSLDLPQRSATSFAVMTAANHRRSVDDHCGNTRAKSYVGQAARLRSCLQTVSKTGIDDEVVTVDGILCGPKSHAVTSFTARHGSTITGTATAFSSARRSHTGETSPSSASLPWESTSPKHGCVRKVSRSDVKQAREIFDKLDTDGDGVVSLNDIMGSLRAKTHHSNPMQAFTTSKRTQIHKDVTFAETLCIFHPRLSKDEAEALASPEKHKILSASDSQQIKHTFLILDNNRDGTLTSHEVVEGLQKANILKNEIDEIYFS